jgi:diguanylate cyclase (GGDEF)-like protein
MVERNAYRGVEVRRNGGARGAPKADPYRRLPSIVFRLLREETTQQVRAAVAETLPLLVQHDSLRLESVDPEEIRRALAATPGEASIGRPELDRAPRNPVSLPLVAHGVLLGELEVGRWNGRPFAEPELGVLAAFAELAALALHKAHAAEELHRLAHTDPLTGLANRRGLNRALEEAGCARSLLLLDLDGLKEVNDELGYDEGDLVIRAAADLLGSRLFAGELAARLGGDEFVALLDCDAEERAAEVGLAVDALTLPPAIRSRFRGGSVGVVSPLPDEPPDELLRRAAALMKARKRERKDSRTL